MVNANVIQLLYLVSAALFILGMKNLTKVKSARRGNTISASAMLLAIIATVLEIGLVDYRFILIGLVVGTLIGGVAAIKVQMTEMPEMVALFNGFGGGSSALVAISTAYLIMVEPSSPIAHSMSVEMGAASAFTLALSLLIGAVTLSGSVIAYLKLRGQIKGEPILIPGRHVINALFFLGSLGIGVYAAFGIPDPNQVVLYAWGVIGASLVLGILLVIPIGGADMPVVISLLNSYSGIAAAMTGFVINNNVLIVAGALVGASGLILTNIMCVAMNRSLTNVIFGGFGAEDTSGGGGKSTEYGPIRSGGPEEAAMLLESASRVMIVPGYGLAVAQAQHTVKELADLLAKNGTRVDYAVHPVAGRMPGHMNVLLAEADVPYEALLELDTANAEFKDIDVAIIIGANDVVNPGAEKDPQSPIAGMPILQAYNAQSVIMIKRSLGVGFANIKNELFEYPNTMMLFSDAKKALQGMVSELKDS